MLEVQEELLAQLAAALEVAAARLLLVQIYAAGQYAVIDILPTRHGGGEAGEREERGDVTAEALQAQFLGHAH